MALRSEKLDGDLGEEGLERWEDLGVLGFLHWSFGLLGSEEVVVAATEVRHRRLEVPDAG